MSFTKENAKVPGDYPQRVDMGCCSDLEVAEEQDMLYASGHALMLQAHASHISGNILQ